MDFVHWPLVVVLTSGAAQSAALPAPPQEQAPGPQKKTIQVDPAALPVDLERIQKALANTPRLQFDESRRPVFRVEVFGEKPTIDDILGPDWAKAPCRTYMTHQEFLNLVTPKDVQATPRSQRAGATVATTSFLLQWTFQKAIQKFNETQTSAHGARAGGARRAEGARDARAKTRPR